MKVSWRPYKNKCAYLKAVDVAFTELRQIEVKNKEQKFHRHIIQEAYKLQVKSHDSRNSARSRLPLSLDKKFYVYALLDPRKPGTYTYKLYGKTVTLKHQPFYVGKGNGSRMYAHLREARKGVKSHKASLIRKIWRANKEPICLKLSADSIEALAFAKEVALIDAIGRLDLAQLGPLTNQSNGGEGLTGASKLTRRRMSRSAKGNPKPPQTEEHIRKRVAARLETKKEQKANGTYVKHKAPKKSQEMKNRWKTDTKYRELMAQVFSQPKSETHKKNISKALKGKPKSEAHKKAMRGIVRPTIKCPHCSKVGVVANMNRWHFDNCRNR